LYCENSVEALTAPPPNTNAGPDQLLIIIIVCSVVGGVVIIAIATALIVRRRKFRPLPQSTSQAFMMDSLNSVGDPANRSDQPRSRHKENPIYEDDMSEIQSRL
jgi:hypothetical protein